MMGYVLYKILLNGNRKQKELLLLLLFFVVVLDRIHGPTMICPFPRVLSNFVSVCLAAIYNFFEDRKKYLFIYFLYLIKFILFLFYSIVFDLKIKIVVELMKKRLKVN